MSEVMLEREAPAGSEQISRCWWCGEDELYQQYHDQEWGMPIADDVKLFEKICLEGFQAGLSWLTILRKRENFRIAFAGFDFAEVARYGKRDINRLLNNEGIVRHQGKINSTINNANRALELVEEFGSLSNFFWGFEPSGQASIRDKQDIPAITAESKNLCKELKKRGWTFVGPTTCYAFMQAMGMVNDHLQDCGCWSQVEQARIDFLRPL
ncbi:MAG: DNA-3-methyladenine glycosylase I [Planctomycetaceae bacterium]|nr:DNA-3-methyladenine glycosylase I [Planctomycetaceae bacterium]